MKAVIVKMLIIFLGTLSLVACSNKSSKPAPVTSESNLQEPTKNILVTEGDLNKKYSILGQVEYAPQGGTSIYSDQINADKQAKEILKKVAFAKYGEKVDAIIHFKSHQSIKGGFWGALGAGYGAHSVATQVEGIAIAFQESENQSYSVDKAKPTSATAKGKSKSRKKH